MIERNLICFLQKCLQLAGHHPLNQFTKEWNIGNRPLATKIPVTRLGFFGMGLIMVSFKQKHNDRPIMMCIAHSIVKSFADFKSHDGQGYGEDVVAL